MTIYFLIFTAPSFGQRSINGTFSYRPGMGGMTLILNDNFEYKYEDFTCVTKKTDIGIYELHEDTIIFHSSLKPDDLINRTITIGSMHSLLNKSRAVDTLFIIINNKTGVNQNSASIRLGDSLIQFIDTIHADETKFFKFLVNKFSNSINVTLDIGNEKSNISGTNFITFNLYSDSRYEKEILNDKMIFEDNKIYPLSVFNITNKKIYLELIK